MILRKLYAGDRLHKTRLHDEKGNFAGWRNVLLNGPPAVFTGLLRLGIAYRPALPWISYSAINRLRRFLTPQSRVLEFGSGMSTIWFATRAAEVCSVDDCRPWYDKVAAIIRERGFPNVRYEFAPEEDDYTGFMAGDKQGFDLILVDGNWRSKCIARAADMLRSGGILYLDNCDKDSEPRGGDMRLAEDLARQFASRRGASITLFTDFAPTQLFAGQGLLVDDPGQR